MTERYAPAIGKLPRILHGGDYNPDQWRDEPAIIDRDFRIMPEVGVNIVSLGIFGWSALEPAEGRYEFEWMDRIMDRMAELGGVVALATPSAARPPWLAHKYRETSRVTYQGLREPYAGRHNHCYSSPVMREKIAAINERLAERYAQHPSLGLWHISNEYGGECFCEHCMAAWQRWLKDRYGTIEALNEAWWADFWSHRYTDWAEITPKDGAIEGEKIDWSRFVTERTVDFMNHEIAAVRKHDPVTPATTNFMGFFGMLDYRRFEPHLDVIANDWYPGYNVDGDLAGQAAASGFTHELMRGMKGGRPWLLMESTPSTTNWQGVAKLKRPGQHRLECLQAISQGSDSVMYFQFRKGRGATEKFHGAIVDFADEENTRVIREVAEVGRIASKLDEVVGLGTPSEVALIVDWENNWAVEKSMGLGNRKKQYAGTCQQWYRSLWRMNVPTRIIGDEHAFEGYKLLIAPMLHLIKPGVGERLRAFVEGGGTLVLTYLSGLVDEHMRCFMGGWPGAGLRELAGVWVEEQDVIYDADEQSIMVDSGVAPGFGGEFEVNDFCDLMHAEGASVMATFGKDFYAGRPAVTTHTVGRGRCIYVGARTDDAFLDALLGGVCGELGVGPALGIVAPAGVSVQHRTDGVTTFAFLLNFTRETRRVEIGGGWVDAIEGGSVDNEVELDGLGSMVLRRG